MCLSSLRVKWLPFLIGELPKPPKNLAASANQPRERFWRLSSTSTSSSGQGYKYCPQAFCMLSKPYLSFIVVGAPTQYRPEARTPGNNGCSPKRVRQRRLERWYIRYVTWSTQPSLARPFLSCLALHREYYTLTLSRSRQRGSFLHRRIWNNMQRTSPCSSKTGSQCMHRRAKRRENAEHGRQHRDSPSGREGAGPCSRRRAQLQGHAGRSG